MNCPLTTAAWRTVQAACFKLVVIKNKTVGVGCV